jgi:Domain of unknown function (DUF4260)
MKTFIKLEELTLVALSFYLFLALDYAWWWFPVLFFVPDASLIGYLINSKVGIVTYNFIHHKALAILLYLFGGRLQPVASLTVGRSGDVRTLKPRSCPGL